MIVKQDKEKDNLFTVELNFEEMIEVSKAHTNTRQLTEQLLKSKLEENFKE